MTTLWTHWKVGIQGRTWGFYCSLKPISSPISCLRYNLTAYPLATDIYLMLLGGFGFLMTFLKRYGMSAIGFTMIVTVIVTHIGYHVLGIADVGGQYSSSLLEPTLASRSASYSGDKTPQRVKGWKAPGKNNKPFISFVQVHKWSFCSFGHHHSLGILAEVLKFCQKERNTFVHSPQFQFLTVQPGGDILIFISVGGRIN